MRTCACILETYVHTDTTIYIARLIIEHPREWLASLADYMQYECSMYACILLNLYFARLAVTTELPFSCSKTTPSTYFLQ